MNSTPRPRTPTAQAQAQRLRRILLGSATYLTALLIAIMLWWLNYIPLTVLLSYGVMLAAINLFFYAAVRSGLNLRFADPNMNRVQIALAIATGYYVMYHAQEARGMLLLLIVTAAMYALFQFRARDFVRMTAMIVLGYAALILMLYLRRPSEVNLVIEVLQLVTLTACLLQFSSVGALIVKLRTRAVDSKRELEKRNGQLEQAQRRIEELAMRDELTGAYNRRHLMETVRIEKQRSRRTGSPFTICILDLDFFKHVNDQYGSLAGDQVLRDIAVTAGAALRETDYFGRYGGEEFACVLTDTGPDGALITAERIRNSIAALRFSAIDPALAVTVSIGIADCAQQDEPDSAFRRADEALYLAKMQGRNRCIVSAAVYQVPG